MSNFLAISILLTCLSIIQVNDNYQPKSIDPYNLTGIGAVKKLYKNT
jgi:hypothetical protein